MLGSVYVWFDFCVQHSSLHEPLEQTDIALSFLQKMRLDWLFAALDMIQKV